jgi:hypothetical protein
MFDENKKVKWLVYTVAVGLIPIVSRFLIWLIIRNKTINLLSASDFISFGLVLHISNINEIEHFTLNKSWKTIQNGVSIIFISFYGLLFSLVLISENNDIFDKNILVFCTIFLAAISLLLSYSVYDRLSSLSKTQKE